MDKPALFSWVVDFNELFAQMEILKISERLIGEKNQTEIKSSDKAESYLEEIKSFT